MANYPSDAQLPTSQVLVDPQQSVSGTGRQYIDIGNVGGGSATVAIAASFASNTVVKASPGRLGRILVTTLGTNAMLIYDNATTNSGTIIGVVPASAAVGTVVDCQLPAANGITVAGSATNPAVTIGYFN